VTARSTIQLDELDQTGVRCKLREDDVDALRQTRLVRLRPEGRGAWRMRPNGRVGCVSVDGLDVTVRSKASPASLLFYLSYAKDPGFRPENVPAVAGDDLWPAFAETLARNVEQALRDGVLQGYRPVDDSLCVIRGRVRVSDQLTRRPGLPAPVEIQYDDYTVDIPENQILRAAIQRMLGVPRLSVGARRRLVHLDRKLFGAAPAVPNRLPTWQENRLNRRYQSALRVAEIVLENQSAVSKGGTASLASFVINMDSVFENFVVAAIREAFRGVGTTTGSHVLHLADDDRIRMQPDVVHLRDNRPVAVFDAKYKLGKSSGKYSNPDVYQMLAYCTGLQLQQGWLIYAVGEAEKSAVRVTNGGIEIHQHAIDLRLHPTEVLDRIDYAVKTSVAHLTASV
jgi:5-methylcytosine-specific restriction enzyme subunit McrC